VDRAIALEQLDREHFDLLVIGGGITGAGTALDAAFRGLRVALVEKDDFASGTSSRSSKLIHGGLRYLKGLEFGLVREGLRERRELERMAPHLVSPLRFVVPRYGRLYLGIRAGLFAYDALAIGSGYPRHESLGPDEVTALSPMLREPAGGLSFWDARTDDARLVWNVARTAQRAGATIVNHAKVVALLHAQDKVAGASVKDEESGRVIDVRARVVVNATGVWADQVRGLEATGASVGIRPSRGTHIVFRASRLPTQTALLLPTPDRRFVFVIPWFDDSVIVGTTDSDYEGPLEDPQPSEEEIRYLLDVVDAVTEYRIDRTDVIASFAGLRPLVRSRGRTKDISRRHVVDVGPGGMVTITGGKLTSWRRMATDAVNTALAAGAFDYQPVSRTHEERLSGAAFADGVVPALGAVLAELGLDESHAKRLYHRYGSLGAEVLRLVRDDASLGQRLHPQAPYLRAEAEYAITTEMARTVEDVLARRLRLTLTTPDGGRAAFEWVANRLDRKGHP
jgi:glycerol-3-phosphate dehydrogenase